MLPLVDKPVIQFVVEELVDAGITDIILVTGYHKRTIEDHFDTASKDLIENLRKLGERKKHHSLMKLRIYLSWQILFMFGKKVLTVMALRLSM